jgi:uncharacterized protein (TIGR02266 family)
MSDERRSYRRFDIELPGRLGTGLDAESIDMVLDNLSIGGCFIKTDRPEAPGSELDLRFILPGVQGVSVTAKGRVCWLKSDDAGNLEGMGVQFTRLAADQMTKLKRYLAGFLDSDPGH